MRLSSLTALFYRYFIGAMGELWQYARYEQYHSLIASTFGLPSINHVVAVYRANIPFHKEIYAQICRLIDRH